MSDPEEWLPIPGEPGKPFRVERVLGDGNRLLVQRYGTLEEAKANVPTRGDQRHVIVHGGEIVWPAMSNTK